MQFQPTMQLLKLGKPSVCMSVCETARHKFSVLRTADIMTGKLEVTNLHLTV